MDLNFKGIRIAKGWSIEFTANLIGVSEDIYEELEVSFDKYYFDKYLILCDIFEVDVRLLFKYLFLTGNDITIVFDLINFYEKKLNEKRLFQLIPEFAEN